MAQQWDLIVSCEGIVLSDDFQFVRYNLANERVYSIRNKWTSSFIEGTREELQQQWREHGFDWELTEVENKIGFDWKDFGNYLKGLRYGTESLWDFLKTGQSVWSGGPTLVEMFRKVQETGSLPSNYMYITGASNWTRINDRIKGQQVATGKTVSLEAWIEANWNEAWGDKLEINNITAPGFLMVLGEWLDSQLDLPGLVGQDAWFLNEDARELADMIADWNFDPGFNGDMSKYSDEGWRATVLGILNQKTIRPVAPAGAAVGIVDATLAAFLRNTYNFIRDQQVLYGEEGGGERAMKFLMEYAQHAHLSPWKFPETVPKDLHQYVLPSMLSGAFPDMTDPDEWDRFQKWFGDKVSAQEEQFAEEAKILRRDEFIKKTMTSYLEAFPGGLGQRLWEAMYRKYVEKGDLDLLSEMEFAIFPTAEEAYREYIPEGGDLERIANLAGIDPATLLVTGGLANMDIGQQLRQKLLEESQIQLAKGRMDESSSEILRIELNALMEALPMPSSGRTFYMTQAGAEIEFEDWLAANVSPEYRDEAWNYRGQLWQQYKTTQDRSQPEGKAPFSKLMGSMGSTFFSRLSPRKHKPTEPTTIRPPGGGRVPMQ